MYRTVKTKPARSAAPPLARASANIFAALANKTKYVDPALAQRWPELAGEKLASLSRPGRITGQPRDKTLEIHVATGAAAAVIQSEADALRKRINAYLGPRSVARLAIRQSGRHAERAGATPKSAPAGRDDDSPLGDALRSFRSAVKRRGPEK